MSTFTIAIAPHGERVERKGRIFGAWAVHYERRDWLYRITQIKSGLGTGDATLGMSKAQAWDLAKWCDAQFGDMDITEVEGAKIAKEARRMLTPRRAK